MDLQEISEESWIQWKKKRRNTLIGYLLVATMVGIDYSFMFTTLYVYLEEAINTDRPRLYYGIIVVIYSLSSTLFGTVCGKWADETRQIKLYTKVTLILQIIGCLLYAVHLSVIYPLIGRMICGFGDPFPSVSSGEVLRMYDKEGGTRTLWWLAYAYSLGIIIGPVFVVCFKNVHVSLWTFHITQLNVIAIFMAIMLLVTLVIVNCLIHDCSAEMNLKEHLQQNNKANNEKMEICEDVKSAEETSLLMTTDHISPSHTFPLNAFLRSLFDMETAWMFISIFLFLYCLFATDILVPLLTAVSMDWNLSDLSCVLVGYGVVYFTLLTLVSKFCTGDHGVSIVLAVVMTAQIVMLLTMIAMKVFERNKIRDIVLMLMLVNLRGLLKKS